MSIPMAGFTAISTGDLAFTVYAAAATVIPVGFVSRVASRRQLRLAVLASAVAAAPLAASVEWLFTEDSMPLQAALWAFLGALAAGLIAQGLVSFLENAFGITTSLTLLDLLDRNHPALRRIEEAAPGTFNHSMLVGALAGRAARAIGADPLLAQAAAWYHDLGKTEHPQYFVENQFGVSNPHDSLPPEESAAIIRSHVTEGLRLARRFRIPPDVADGIRMHHGDSLMRFFYHKALAQNPDVDPDLFRHHGVRPRQKEMAIVMISDSIEAAARAYSQEEDPTAEGLQRVVDSVVEEKVTDGQLDRSALTFGDLTAVKGELVQALMGYYHARVPYPGFPGPRVMDAKPVPALPETPTALPESRSEVPG
jgi:putative nucleotidyltransferase with HDIG domain